MTYGIRYLLCLISPMNLNDGFCNSLHTDYSYGKILYPSVDFLYLDFDYRDLGIPTRFHEEMQVG